MPTHHVPPRHEALLLLALGLLLGFPPVRAGSAPLPVGYDHPEADQGGPTGPQGFAWMDQTWSRRVIFANKLPGGPLRTVFFLNQGGQIDAYEMGLRLPLEATRVVPAGGATHVYARPACFDPLRELFAGGQRVDVFVFCRISLPSIPLELQYEILRRVKEEGSGLVEVDQIDGRFESLIAAIKPFAKGPQILQGIPYEGFQKMVYARSEPTPALNIYRSLGGALLYDPQAQPYVYGPVTCRRLGQGIVVTVDTTSGGNRAYGPACLVPDLEQSRDMWAQRDYFLSHSAKAMLLASGRPPALQITGMQPRGTVTGAAQVPELSLIAPGGAFSGRLRWQIRDMWGLVTTSGQTPLTVPAEGSIVPLNGVSFRDAGRQFLDVWVDNAAGETVDWGSTFVDLDRGVPAPVLTPQHPDGTPRGAPLQGTVTVAQAPAGATVRVSLVDRYWREVGRTTSPAAEGGVAYSFPTEGLEGQIWRVQADVLDQNGHALARAFRNVTSPRSLAQMGSFRPLAVLPAMTTPECSALRRMVHSFGYVGRRMYSAGYPLLAQEDLWDDIQPQPFPTLVTRASDDFSLDWQTDWEDPLYRRQSEEMFHANAVQMKPFGLFGMALTDDSSANRELPLGAYTMIAFHKWLQARYGDFPAVCKAWGWTPEPEKLAADELPYNPYVVVRFHQWLAKKYGGLDQLSVAWKIPVKGMGSLHEFGAIQRAMVAKQKAKGNLLPSNDVQEYLRTGLVDEDLDEPFGRITPLSVKAGYDAGQTAAWIDAQIYLEGQWLGTMVMVQNTVRSVVPDAAVGSDAAGYGANFARIASTLGYLAPYFDEHQVKVAADRGRLAGNGNYGGVIGTYGGKPSNMSGRRAQIWQALFAGANCLTFWSWAYGHAFGPNWELNDAHARYQAEATEELATGIGELFAGSPRIYAPVAILDSQTSRLCDQLEAEREPVSGAGGSVNAFLDVCQDLGLTARVMISSELVSGWLARHQMRVLILAGSNSLSDEEIEAVQAFVQAGGTVIADTLPGRRTPNGTLRAQAPLADLFGVAFDAQSETRRVRGILRGRTGAADAPQLSFGEALADPRLKPTEAVALGSVGGAPTLMIHTVGKGKTVLLNASFPSYATFRAEGGAIWQPWYDTLKRVLADAGLTTSFPFTSEGQATAGFALSPFQLGAGYLLGVEDLGTADFPGPRRPVEITLPQPFHVYDVRAGKYLGQLATLKAELPRRGHRAYALLPYQVQSLKVTADHPVCQAGDTVTLTADLVTSPAGPRARHVLRLEALDPAGQLVPSYRRILVWPATGALTLPLTTAFNDAPGAWKLQATDVTTGVTTTVPLQIQGAA